MNEKNNLAHESVKKKLKIAGICLLAVGLVCTIIGMADFFAAFNSEGERMPKLFFMCFIGLPLIAVGAGMLIFGFKREIMRYAKNESVPVINEAGEEISPAVKSVVTAAREGVAQEKADKTVCSCGAVNADGSKFCKECGKALYSVCPNCGAKTDPESKYCNECGTKL